MPRTSEEYIQSVRDGREVYYRGKRVDDITTHPVLRIAVAHAADLFNSKDRLYDDPNYGRISKYFKIPRNTEDLLARHRLIYEDTLRFDGLFNIVQAIGSDALFSLMIMARKVDGKYRTNYYERVMKYYEYVVKNDLAIAVAQTDVKGHRAKRPHEQQDPDLYLRVVEVRDDGIVVNGAKIHTTQGPVANEIIVLPYRAMVEGDRDYAVAFAVPANAKGLKFIVRPVLEYDGNPNAVNSAARFEVESLTIFDHVFIPWDRVFLFREWDMAGPLAWYFATYHRFTAISYRAATANLYLGAALLAARANGIENAPHVRDWIIQMIMYKEIMRMGAMAAALEPIIDEGIAVPNPVYTNVSKLYSNAHFIDVIHGLIDIAGGLIATMPSHDDLRNNDERGYITKYLAGAVDGETRYKIMSLVRELSASHLAGYLLTAMIHAEGSEAASKIGMMREYNFREAEELVNRVLSKLRI
ncbi:4-hydroxyphenylacetate 3-hydroxylase N-terminal domain-containing protein [Vulcanisaeta thermophila]|uniref:4-hydroxyphenylacetate 3-hydroxylase N-terminal domain-containing protein n=1 Tax=Vulcanisaeta thermophila TaxID=867917 RepID=UPI0008536942|nr:4-hydroxyphenylacetate 3-hydroxylase N-terminal domain-containing protein [Vulcanisaeta thermophila]